LASSSRFIERGADVNAQGGEYSNALDAASIGGHLETVKILLERGSDINAQGGFYGDAVERIKDQCRSRSTDALCAASGGGHLEIVNILLERGAFLVTFM
jgi:ankyrin repeat protein